jgi:hypothetical protein
MDESIGVFLFLMYLRPVWFKNSSAAKRPKIHHDFGKNHGKSHPR